MKRSGKISAAILALVVSVAAAACKNDTHEHEFVKDESASVSATCESGGEIVYKCSVCGETKTETTEKLGHNFGEWAQKTPATCVDAQVLERKCLRDGCAASERKSGEPALGHDYGGWQTVDGKLRRYCRRDGCDDYEEKDAPVLRVFPSSDRVTQFTSAVTGYLTAEVADVADYCGGITDDGIKGYTVHWRNTYDGVSSCKVEYSESEDFADSVFVDVAVGDNECVLYNLKKATTYYLRVVIVADGEEKTSDPISFGVRDLGPRVMKIDGIHNVRDLGGYVTPEGRTVQGIIYRGGALSPESYYPNVGLTDAGKAYMKDTLKIKTDFDLRNAAQNNGLTTSPLTGATLEYYNADGYDTGIANKETYRKIFAALSDENRYPVYLHCTGGADRTGTVSFLLNALLGVSETDLVKDYEYTSFSIYGERNSKGGEPAYRFAELVAAIKAYSGETLAEKTEKYLLSAGVTETQIYNIRAIMLGKDTKTEEPENTVPAFDFSDGNITLDSESRRAVGNAIGYDGTIAYVKITETSDRAGGTYVFIGSYGFYIRGDSVRVAKRNGDAFAEVAPRVEPGYIYQSVMQSGAVIGMSAKIKSDSTMTLTLCLGDSVVCVYDFTRAAGEIAGENAKFEVEIGGGATNAVLTQK